MLEGLRLRNARNAYIRSYRDRKTKNDYDNQNFLVYECSLEKTFWRIYMKRVLENIRQMACNKEPYQYE